MAILFLDPFANYFAGRRIVRNLRHETAFLNALKISEEYHSAKNQVKRPGRTRPRRNPFKYKGLTALYRVSLQWFPAANVCLHHTMAGSGPVPRPGGGSRGLDYAKNYERCCKEKTNFLQEAFIGVLSRKAQALGQQSHKMWSLKYVLDTYFAGRSGLRIMDCGAWDGWFLSYDSPAVAQRIALDFDPHFARDLRARGLDFVLADMESGHLPVGPDALDLVAMTSTLEHLSCPEKIATEIRRILKPGGIAFITVPDIMKYKFRFWDDVTHKRPFNKRSLRFLFETHGMETLELCAYNHNLFIAGNLFPKPVHHFLTRFRGNALMYVGRKPA